MEEHTAIHEIHIDDSECGLKYGLVSNEVVAFSRRMFL